MFDIIKEILVSKKSLLKQLRKITKIFDLHRKR